MKILHVIPSVDPATGGPVAGLRQLCHIYQNAGHEVEVASLDSPESIGSYNSPAPVFALGPAWGTYGFTFRAVKWLKANLQRYDVAFIDGIWQYNALALHRALAGCTIPYAVFSHGMLDPYFKENFPLKHIKKSIYWHLFLRRILRDANAVLFTSDEERILARRSFRRYEVREIVIHYGIYGPDCDTEAAAAEFLTRWPALRGKLLAISLGRIHPKKGTDILIEAFARTLARDTHWHLVIAGPDSVGWQKDLEALASRLGVADRITWTGMLTGTVKWGALSASEVFVLPSHQENFGIVIAEAMACNLPVILSDKVNIWREVANCGACFVCNDTVEGSAACLARWQALDMNEKAALRLRSKRCFDELFNYDVSAKRVLEIVDQLAQEPRVR